MTKDVVLRMEATQRYPGEEPQSSITQVSAEYYLRNGSHYVMFEETQEGFTEKTKGMLKIKDGSVDAQIKILEAMTATERAEPEKIFANAKARIAETAGCTVREVEHMIKQYTKMKQQMAMIQRMGGMEAVMQRMQQGGFPGAK